MGRVGFELVCMLVERGFLAHFDNVLFCLTGCQVYTLLLLSQWATGGWLSVKSIGFGRGVLLPLQTRVLTRFSGFWHALSAFKPA